MPGRILRTNLRVLCLTVAVLLWQAGLMPAPASSLASDGPPSPPAATPQVEASTESESKLEKKLPPELSDYYYRILAYHTRSCGIVPAGSYIFIGDSITQGQCVTAIAPSSVNYGIGSDTTLGVIERLDDYQPALEKAAGVIIAIGINDFSRRSNDAILDNFEIILDKLPTVPVYLSSLLPVGAELRDKQVGEGLQSYSVRILEINRRLKELASTRANVTYVDNTEYLDQDRDGALDEGYQTGDGVHLNSLGNGQWAKSLREQLGIVAK